MMFVMNNMNKFVRVTYSDKVHINVYLPVPQPPRQNLLISARTDWDFLSKFWRCEQSFLSTISASYLSMQINYLIDLICMEPETLSKHLTKVKKIAKY